LTRPEPDRTAIPDPGGEAPPFAEPWQAQAFALVVALHRRGVFTWSDWAAALSAELSRATPDGSDYYHCWLDALEGLLADRGLADLPAQAPSARGSLGSGGGASA
jgi:nitrile hydratase accessory protein